MKMAVFWDVVLCIYVSVIALMTEAVSTSERPVIPEDSRYRSLGIFTFF
jgi:hypothetical protein